MKGIIYAALTFGLCTAVAAQAPLNYDVENRGKDLGATAGQLKSNKKLPNYSQLTKVELQEVPFEKTPKMSIKRFLYK